jgi:hypothetical protein
MVDFLLARPPEEGRAVRLAYQEHLQFLSFRSGLPASRLMRMVPILRRYAQYEQHASGLPSMLKDLALKQSR